MYETFNWLLFFEATPFGEQIYLNWLLEGMVTTVALSCCAWLIAFVLGSVLGVIRTLPYPFCRSIGLIYVEVFRNTPLIVQFFIWYLAAPLLLPTNWQQWFLSELNPQIQIFITATLCLGFFTAARIAEQVRTGIQALPPMQQAAALALGLNLTQSYRYVLLPNAYRIIIPPLTSEMTSLVKNSAIASTIGLLELMSQANRLVDFSAYTLESYLGVTLCYMSINFIILLSMSSVEKRIKRKFSKDKSL